MVPSLRVAVRSGGEVVLLLLESFDLENEAMSPTRLAFAGSHDAGRSKEPPLEVWYTFFAMGPSSLAMSMEDVEAPMMRTVLSFNETGLR